MGLGPAAGADEAHADAVVGAKHASARDKRHGNGGRGGGASSLLEESPARELRAREAKGRCVHGK